MTALYIILGVLLLIALLLTVRIRVFFTFDGEATVVLKILFFKKTLVPPPEKKEKKPKPPKQPKEKSDKQTEKSKPEELSYLDKIRQKKGLSGLVSLLTGLAKLAGGALKYLASHTVIRKLDVGVAINAGDAASTAITYGRLCSAIYPAVNVITAVTVCRSYNVTVEPIFDSEQQTWASAEVHAYLRLFFLVVEGIRAGIRLLLLRFRMLKG